jgi:predicted nuclease of predicted toxin-antitoxin system
MVVGEKINVVLTQVSNGQYMFVSIAKKAAGTPVTIEGAVLKVIDANKVEIKFTKPDKAVVTRTADLANHKMIVGEKINVVVNKLPDGQYVFASIAKKGGSTPTPTPTGKVTVEGAVLKVIDANKVEIKFTKPDKAVVTRTADLTNHKMVVGEKIDVVVTKVSNGQYMFVSIAKKGGSTPTPAGTPVTIEGAVLKVVDANKVEIRFTKPDKAVVTRTADLANHKMTVGEKINVVVNKLPDGQYVFASIAKKGGSTPTPAGTPVTIEGAVLKVIDANKVEIKFTKPDKAVVTRTADLTNHKMAVGEKIKVVVNKLPDGQYVFASIAKK